jgi:hypothetical protein
VNAHGLSPQALAATVASLPHLTSLTLGAEVADDADSACQVLCKVVGQLTHLSFTMPDYGMSDFGTLTALLKRPDTPMLMRQLRRISLNDAKLDDSGLCALTTHLPQLTHVAVGCCELQTSHADNLACSWETLRITGCLDTTALTRLPLRGIRKLEVDSVMSAGTTPTEVAAALAAVPDCVLSCPIGCLELECDFGELAVLLSRMQCEVLRSVILKPSNTDRLTPAAVETLVAFLERTPSCSLLHIEGFPPPATLLPALHRTAVSELYLGHDEMTEAQLMAWCTGHVGHPLRVSFTDGRLFGSLTRVVQVLQEGGGDVTLDYDFSRDDDDVAAAAEEDDDEEEA